MTKVTWILEKNVFSEACFDRMVEHFNTNDIPYHIVRIKPFIHEIEGPVPEVNGPVVVYGSIGAQKLARAQGWLPGVWSSDLFNETIVAENIKESYLNYDAQVVLLRNVLSETTIDPFFIKPNTDTKEFAGQVMTRAEFAAWLEKMHIIGYFDEAVNDIEVVVSQPKDVLQEWRLIVVNGKVVASSQYRAYQKVMPKMGCPDLVISFAEILDEEFHPADVYVIDICTIFDGSLKVVEYNTFNSAGFYEADVTKIIDEINRFLA